MNWSFRTIRNLGLCALLFIIVGVSLFSYYTIHATGEEVAEFMAVEQTKLAKWFEFLDAITDSKDYLYDFQLGKNAVASPAMLLVNQAIELVGQIKEQTADEVELAQIDKLTRELRKYRQAVYIYIEEISGGYRDGATAREMEVISHKAAQDIVQMSLKVTDLISHTVEDRSRDILRMTRASQRILYVVLALSVLCTFVISIVMGKALAGPIRKLAKAAKNISEGDLASRVQIDSNDEMGLLAAAFNDMAEKICERTEEIANSNEQLHQEVADRKQAEKTLMKAKKEAEAANEAKSQFLANMSHEIRTPMNAIIGFTEMVLQEDLSGDVKQYLQISYDSAKHLLSLINDILDFSKIETGQIDVEIVDCSLSELVGSIDSMMAKQAADKGLDFKVITENELPARVRTDPNRVRQCLLNLVGNAIKFTEHGHVYVRVRLLQEAGQSWIHFAVEDTGIGILADKHDLIFDAFSQADGSSTREFGGTGLGLSITKQLAELMGGSVDIESTEGKGSTFSFVIPVGTSSQTDPVEQAASVGG